MTIGLGAGLDLGKAAIRRTGRLLGLQRNWPWGTSARIPRRTALASAAACALAASALSGFGLATAPSALAAGNAPGAPGANATWNESNLQAFAGSLGSASKVWYTLGNGELENVFYPETDTRTRPACSTS